MFFPYVQLHPYHDALALRLFVGLLAAAVTFRRLSHSPVLTLVSGAAAVRRLGAISPPLVALARPRPASQALLLRFSWGDRRVLGQPAVQLVRSPFSCP